jgi:hypothetical protein
MVLASSLSSVALADPPAVPEFPVDVPEDPIGDVADDGAPAGDYRPAGTVQGSGEDRVSGAPAGGGTLPFTGDSLWVVFLIGFVMVAVGAGLYVLSIVQLRWMRPSTVLRGVRHGDRGVFGNFR